MMKRKFIARVVSLSMAAIMTLASPISAYAETGAEFSDEILQAPEQEEIAEDNSESTDGVNDAIGAGEAIITEDISLEDISDENMPNADITDADVPSEDDASEVLPAEDIIDEGTEDISDEESSESAEEDAEEEETEETDAALEEEELLGDEEPQEDTEGVKTIDISGSGKAPALQKVWNDNTGSKASDPENMTDRPTPDAFKEMLDITFSVQNEGEGAESYTYEGSYDEASWAAFLEDLEKNLEAEEDTDIRISAEAEYQPIPDIGDASNQSRWNYALTMPTVIKVKVVKNVEYVDPETEEPEIREEEVNYSYSVSYTYAERDIEGYICQADETNTIFTNTAEIDWKAEVDFVDNGNIYESRPDEDAFKADLSVWYFKNGDVNAAVQLTAEELAEAGIDFNIEYDEDGTCQLSLVNAPAYNEKGEPVSYYVKMVTEPKEICGKTEEVCFESEAGAYAVQYSNVGNNSTQTNAVFNKGTCTAVLENEMEFIVTKNWEDYHSKNRPDCTLYLYRISESDKGTISKDRVEDASPVRNFDSMEVQKEAPEGEPDTDSFEITFTYQGDTKLPMYDNRGHRYVYFVLERGLSGDYKEIIDNTGADASEDAKKVFATILQNNGSEKYALNNGIITNSLRAVESLAVEKLFVGASMQSMKDSAVRMKLQKYVDGAWVDCTEDDIINTGDLHVKTAGETEEDLKGYNAYVEELGDTVVVRIQNFSAELMGRSAGDIKVQKYELNTEEDGSVGDAGREIKYRFIETEMKVNGSDWTTVMNTSDPSDASADPSYEKVNLGVVGPGLTETDGEGADKITPTTAFFQPSSTANGKHIDNTLVGDTQVKITKTWGIGDGDTVRDVTNNREEVGDLFITFKITRNDGADLVDEDGNSLNEVTMSIEDYDPSEKAWTKLLEKLPRYDENGCEYTYSVEEKAISQKNADGSIKDVTKDWYTEYEFVTSVVDDANGDKVTRLTGNYTNVKNGEGRILRFRVEKKWLDNSDLLTRRAVLVGVYPINEDGSCAERPIATTVLKPGNSWKDEIRIKAAGDSDKESNYVVKEIKVGVVNLDAYEVDGRALYDAAVTLGADSAPDRKKYSYDRKVNVVDDSASDYKLDYFYNVYIENTPDSDDIANYVVSNQRIGVLQIELKKTWVFGNAAMTDGGLDKLAATFQITGFTDKSSYTLKPGDYTVDEDKSDNCTINEDGTFTLAVPKQIETDSKFGYSSSTAKVVLVEINKYDYSGDQIDYKISETAIGVAPVVDNMAQVEADRYVASVAQDGEPIIAGKSKHHSGDIYKWVGKNIRQESYDLTAKKLWGDDGPAKNKAARPDVSFKLYRVSTAKSEELLTAVVDGKDAVTIASIVSNLTGEELSGDKIWNTKYNDWYWSCDLGSVARYDDEGYPYVYYLKEKYTSSSGEYHVAYYNGTAEECTPSDKPNGEVNNTKDVYEKNYDVFKETYTGDDSKAQNVLILSDGYNKNTNGTYGDYYSRTTINYRENNRYISMRKLWQMPSGWGIDYSKLPKVELELYYTDTPIVDEKTGEIKTIYSLSDVQKKIATSTLVNEVTLNENGDGVYSTIFREDSAGKPLMKYDEFGRMQYYYLFEANYRELDNYDPDDVMINSETFTITNVYGFEGPHAEIEVDKTWRSEVDNMVAIAPAVFTLYADIVDADGKALVSKMPMSKATIKPNADGTYKYTFKYYTKNTDATKITDLSTYELLPYLGPNELPLKYYVQETDPNNGYKAEGDLKKDVTLEKQSDKLFAGTVDYTNVYIGGTKNITIQKNWKDDSNDNIDNTDYRVSLKVDVYRKWNKNSLDGETCDYDKTENVPVLRGNVWVQKYLADVELNSGNGWKQSFQKLPKYAPNQAEYTYYVESEKAAVAADDAKLNNYTATKLPADGGTVENKFKFTTISASKTWKLMLDGAEVSSSERAAAFQAAKDAGALPTSIAFVVERRTAGGVWEPMTTANSGIKGSYVIDAAASGYSKIKAGYDKVCGYYAANNVANGGVGKKTWTNLPAYTKDYQEYEYRVVEVLKWKNGEVSMYDGTTYTNSSSAAGTDGMSDGSGLWEVETGALEVDSNKQHKFRNTVETAKVRLIKVWDDNSNRDDTRPATITMTVAVSDPAGSVSGTLNKPDSGDIWTTDIYFPAPKKDSVETLRGKITVSETDIEGYTRDTTKDVVLEYDSENKVYKCSITNVYDNKDDDERVKVGVEATKTFAADSDWASVARPEIKFQLGYYRNGSWNAITSDNIALVAEEAVAEEILDAATDTVFKTVEISGSTGTVSWRGLYKYFERNEDYEKGNPEPIQYAVKEILAYGDGEVTAGSTVVKSYLPNVAPDRASADEIKSKDIAEKEGATKTAYEMAATNTLQTESITLKKTWEDQDGNAIDNLEQLLDWGVLPTKLKFKLSYKTSAAETYTQIPGTAEMVYDTTALVDGVTWDAKLPVYAADGEKISYQLEEIGVSYDGTTYIVPTDANITAEAQIFTLDDAQTTKEVTMENVVPSGQISVAKTWVDGDDQDGLRPGRASKRSLGNVTITLSKNGEVIESATQTITDASDWEGYTWYNLPAYAYDNGEAALIEWKVTEVWEDGLGDKTTKYEATYTYTGSDEAKTEAQSFTLAGEGSTSEMTVQLTNTHIPETREIEATKKWADVHNQDNKRAAFKVALFQKLEGTTAAPTMVPDSEKTIDPALDKDEQTVSWTELPVYTEHGTKIIYTVKETDVPEGYVSSTADRDAEVTDDGTAEITNTYIPETTEINFKKTWEDNNDQDGIRKDLVVALYKKLEGSEDDPVKVTGSEQTLKLTPDENEQECEWKNLPVYEAPGVKIIYTVREVIPDDYTPDVDDGEAEVSYTGDERETKGTAEITNSYEPEITEITVTKIWDDEDNQDGIRKAFTVTLYKQLQGSEKDPEVVDVQTIDPTLDANKQTYTWTELPVYEDHGTLIIYTVKETIVPDDYTSTTDREPVTVEFTGERFEQKGTAEITNKYEPELTEITLTKYWKDQSDQDGIRKAIKVALFETVEGSEEEPTMVPDSERTLDPVLDVDEQTCTWKELPVYKAPGQKIIYTVRELEVPEGYESSTEEADARVTFSGDRFSQKGTAEITNTHIPEIVVIHVKKRWDDEDNKDQVRPKSITVRLLADDEYIDHEDATVVLTRDSYWEKEDGKKAPRWSHTFKGDDDWSNEDLYLPKYRDHGTVVIYSIEEDAIKRYKVKIKGTGGEVLLDETGEPVLDEDGNEIVTGSDTEFTITNKHTPVTPDDPTPGPTPDPDPTPQDDPTKPIPPTPAPAPTPGDHFVDDAGRTWVYQVNALGVPEWVLIGDILSPLAGTGDSANLGLYALLMVLAAAGCVLGVRKYRHKN